MKVVIDTNVLMGAVLSTDGTNRHVIRMCLEGKVRPVISNALFLEYEDVFSREALFKDAKITSSEREQLLNAFLSVCAWTSVYFLWRPNLKDEADNHLIELAVAANAEVIVTNNLRDFQSEQLFFPEIAFLSPPQFLKQGA